MNRTFSRLFDLLALGLVAVTMSMALACGAGDSVGFDEDVTACDEGSTGFDAECERWCSTESVRSKLDQGADIHARNFRGWTPLHCVVTHSKQPKAVELLLDEGADINASTLDDGRTVLDLASSYNEEPAVIDLLLERGANIQATGNDYGSTALHHAAISNEEPAVIVLLLDQGADIQAKDKRGRTPLHLASYANEPAVIASLLDRGADIHARDNHGLTPCASAEDNGSIAGTDIRRRLCEGVNTPIASPIWNTIGFWTNATVTDVRDQLERGADIHSRDDYGNTPLHLAVRITEDPEVVALLLDWEADIHARDDIIGETPLHKAASSNREPAVIELLLDRGANIDARGDLGHTPLHRAASYNEEPAVIALLLDRGANIHAKASGITTLHFAAINKEQRVMELLLDRGADIYINVVDGLGSTPLHSAASSNEPVVVALLLDRGAYTRPKDTLGRTACQRAEDNDALIGTNVLHRLCR